MAHAPTIYRGLADTGIPYRSDDGWGQGYLGDIDWITFHHSAGPRAPTKARAVELNAVYDRYHAGKGWDGIGYHAAMDDLGRFYICRPRHLRGVHTGGHNTNNFGLMIHGNYDRDGLTWAQRRSIKWLFRGGLYVLTGEPERGFIAARGHQEWPGPTNATACPGRNVMRTLVYRRNKDFH